MMKGCRGKLVVFLSDVSQGTQHGWHSFDETVRRHVQEEVCNRLEGAGGVGKESVELHAGTMKKNIVFGRRRSRSKLRLKL